jgi:hypothetical protein
MPRTSRNAGQIQQQVLPGGWVRELQRVQDLDRRPPDPRCVVIERKKSEAAFGIPRQEHTRMVLGRRLGGLHDQAAQVGREGVVVDKPRQILRADAFTGNHPLLQRAFRPGAAAAIVLAAPDNRLVLLAAP